jgi:hypothetical protein
MPTIWTAPDAPLEERHQTYSLAQSSPTATSRAHRTIHFLQQQQGTPMFSSTESLPLITPKLAEMPTAPPPSLDRPILLVNRNSGSGGTKARNQVAKECHRTADDFLRHTGIDVRHLIPPNTDLVNALKHEAVRIESRDEDGRKFTNEYVVLNLAPNVYLLLSTGSGAKIDQDLNQLFLDLLNERLKELQPGWIVWHRIDRVFRTDLLCANTLHICKKLNIKMYDGETGLLDGDFASIMALLRARESAEEASRIPKKTRDGQVDLTDTDMSEGSIRYGVAQVPPAGLMVLRMKAPNGLKGENRLFFDTPACYPRTVDVAYGLPEQYVNVTDLRNRNLTEFDEDLDEAVEDTGEEIDDAARDALRAELTTQLRATLEAELWDDIDHGRVTVARIDQVANVRFALSMLGRPGWTINAVGRELIKRGFSTARLRMENNPRTSFTLEHVDGEVHRVMRPIIAQLEFYRTGILKVQLGVKGVADITIINCFPTDGPWATAEDFNRIETYLGSTKGGGPATQGLTGVTIRTELGILPLRSAPAARRAAGPAYVIRPAEADLRGCTRGTHSFSLPPLPHSVLAASIVEALILHAERLLTPLVQVEHPDTETLRQKLRAAEQVAHGIQSACDAMLDSLGAVDDEGRLLVSGPAVKDISDRYATRTRDQLAPALEKVAQAKAELDKVAHSGSGQDPAIRIALLLRMVESLRDPYDTTYNDLWKGAVRIERITRTPIRVHETAGILTQWEGTIRTEGADQVFSAPFHGRYLTGNAAHLPGKVDKALELLLGGVPFTEIEQSNARGVRLALAERLGFESRYFGLPLCTAPRLVKIATHLAIDPARDVAKVAILLGEPADLVRKVLAQLTSGRPTWASLTAEPGRSTAA